MEQLALAQVEWFGAAAGSVITRKSLKWNRDDCQPVKVFLARA
jgi:hypothetical protein